jgi:hypothetical protein
MPAVWTTVSAVLQLGLAALVVYLYNVENTAFLRVFLLASTAFVVNAILPLALRLPFFTLVSMGGAFLVFSPIDAMWLLGAGSLLIGIANLPVPIKARVLIMIAVAAVAAAARAGLVSAPWSSAVWPIIGSMFMFRLVLYMMHVDSDTPKQRGWWSLSYFFMLPNLVFPLFPVVDYQTFRRTYYDKDDAGIYELGLLWIARGVVHLLLYRYVYYNLIGDAEEIVTLGDLTQFMLATLLLYLRVSGQFHLIVGMLHLFGFRLPETHKLYLLASSFTELWRRINIYWTDFMMKAVFYPTYFRVKDRGPRAALVISTVVVFVITWLLHSYQWFWLRGGFPMTPQDFAFWAILGAFVVYGGLRDLKGGKKPKTLTAKGWDRDRALKTGLTFTCFYLLWSLWSTESLNLWLWMLGAAATLDAKGVLLVVAGFVVMGLLGGVDWKAPRPGTPGWIKALQTPVVRTVVPLVALLALAQPVVQAAIPPRAAALVHSLQRSGLNARDLSAQHRGYYEQLDVRAQLDAPVNAEGRKLDASWQTLDQLGMLNNDRTDLMLRDLKPSKSVTWNGKPFSTNRWGMRDRDYQRTKPTDTLRIAILGPSHVMGNNVADGAVFESIVEERLNREFSYGPYRRFEILNFGVDGFSLPQQLAMLEQRTLGFSPDVVIVSHHRDNREMTQGFLLNVGSRGLVVTDPAIERLLLGAGLREMGTGGLPLPYAFTRRAAEGAGIQARMPYGEARSRAIRVADDVVAHCFSRFAESMKVRGIVAAVLALDVVTEDDSAIPLQQQISSAGLPIIDLFDVYPTDRLDSLRVAPWDDHPNAEGHRIIAEALYHDLTAFLTAEAIQTTLMARLRSSSAVNTIH